MVCTTVIIAHEVTFYCVEMQEFKFFSLFTHAKTNILPNIICN